MESNSLAHALSKLLHLQFLPLYLSAYGLWQFFDEFYLPWVLVGGGMPLYKFLKLLYQGIRRGNVFCEDNKCLHHLAPHLVRAGDNRRLLNGRVLVAPKTLEEFSEIIDEELNKK